MKTQKWIHSSLKWGIYLVLIPHLISCNPVISAENLLDKLPSENQLREPISDLLDLSRDECEKLMSHYSGSSSDIKQRLEVSMDNNNLIEMSCANILHYESKDGGQLNPNSPLISIMRDKMSGIYLEKLLKMDNNGASLPEGILLAPRESDSLLSKDECWLVAGAHEYGIPSVVDILNDPVSTENPIRKQCRNEFR